MSRFNNFKKNISVIVLVILIINVPLVAFARPGGGSSGGRGGGGGRSSSSGGRSSSHSSSRGRSNPIGSIVNLGIFFCMASGGAIILKVKLSKKKIKSVAAIKKLSKNDDNWNYKEIKKNIEDAFYNIGIAWMERNQELAKEYMSDKLYDRHRIKTDWMEVRKEKNILEKMTLLGGTPIGLKDYEGTNKDSLWVHIKAKSIDYTINEETNKVIDGKNYKSVYYEEYWKFIRVKDRWIVDEIKQIDDIDDIEFFEIEINDENY